jgi:hypothetical protein
MNFERDFEKHVVNAEPKQIIYETHANGHWKELFASKNKLLGGHNLAPGEEICATITSVGAEQVYDKETKQNKELVVLNFKNKIPPMALNITNSETIALLHGNSYDKWQGKQILIHTTAVKAFGKVHDALRVRAKIPRTIDIAQHAEKLRECKTIKDLQAVFTSMPKHVQGAVIAVKDEMKGKLS